MVLTEFIALIAAAAPAHPAAANERIAITYNAIVATEETPATNDLAKPAVFIGDGATSAIVAAPDSRSIA